MPHHIGFRLSTNVIKALHRGDLERIKKALKRPYPMSMVECEINDRDENGKSLLFLAAAHGQIEIAKWLLEQPNVVVDSINWGTPDSTPLDIAVARNDWNMISLLLLHNAKIKLHHIANISSSYRDELISKYISNILNHASPYAMMDELHEKTIDDNQLIVKAALQMMEIMRQELTKKIRVAEPEKINSLLLYGADPIVIADKYSYLSIINIYISTLSTRTQKWHLRINAVRGLLEFSHPSDEKVLRALKNASQDEDTLVADAAIEALQKLEAKAVPTHDVKTSQNLLPNVLSPELALPDLSFLNSSRSSSSSRHSVASRMSVDQGDLESETEEVALTVDSVKIPKSPSLDKTQALMPWDSFCKALNLDNSELTVDQPKIPKSELEKEPLQDSLPKLRMF
jgi:ankyrin repeat protein